MARISTSAPANRLATNRLPSNRLLGLLSAKVFKRLSKNLEEVALTLQQDLSPTTLARIYFPLTGMISLAPRLRDGTMIEVGLIGREGFLGVPALLTDASAASVAIVQVTGRALCMESAAFLAETRSNAGFRNILLRYARALMGQISQTAVCNTRHSLSRRLARWLLEAHDRTVGDDLQFSHELLAMMLGTRRAGVTVALGDFRKRGFLSSGHGVVGVRNRRGLEKAACECYAATRAADARLFPKV